MPPEFFTESFTEFRQNFSWNSTRIFTELRRNLSRNSVKIFHRIPSKFFTEFRGIYYGILRNTEFRGILFHRKISTKFCGIFQAEFLRNLYKNKSFSFYKKSCSSPFLYTKIKLISAYLYKNQTQALFFLQKLSSSPLI